jgi:hypothetical protein
MNERSRRPIVPRFIKLPTLGVAAAVSLVCFGFGASDRGSILAVFPVYAQQSPKAAATVSVGGITLHSISVELPGSDRMFPGGAEADAINNTCLACHSAGMVLNQPALTRSAWQQEVDKMRAQYKAPVDDAAVPAIVAYLASHKGVQ